MANFTKKAIRESFVKLLMEKPLSQITVKDIVTDCGVNRNTFYYYFEDIPKLVEDMVMEDAEDLIRSYPTVEKIEDCLMEVVETALSKKKAVFHIYNSINREIYEQYLWKVCDYVIDSYVTMVLNGRRVSDSDLEVIKKYLSSVGFGIISGWLRNGMDDDIRSTLVRICEIKKGMVEQMISRCEESVR